LARFELRYDLRNPEAAATSVAGRYEAALEQIAWGEQHGFRAVTLSEHHGTEDAYLPSPLVFAAAVAARTTTIQIRVAALIASFHDPLRVAEDVAVVDQLSRGRLQLVVANGYVPSEFAMFDRELSGRVPAVVEMIETLKAAWTGEPFEHRGRTVRVTPPTHGGRRPALFLGGASAGAARRAARIADAFFPSDDTYWDVYRQELIARGGPDFGPMPPVGPRFLHVSDDVERDWERLAPFVRNDRESYGSWAEAADLDTGHRRVTDDNGLRDDPEYRVVTPSGCIELVEQLGDGVTMPINPMMGGTPPDLAWESLHRIVDEVMPHTR
jgi:alkanesulfonate monooxygenase SsuD/methylene tetrahydromethanopterin reductase-like flavin-dependent oxidoreductase (luciferase family)